MIHTSVIIDKSAQIGKNVTIGPYSIIGPDTVIGDNCRIDAHSVIEYTELGSDCKVFYAAKLGLEPQHMKYKGEKTKLVVGPRTVFREGSIMHRGTVLDKGVTTIGSDCYFMGLSHIAHDCEVGNNVIIVNGSNIGGHAKIGNNVFISAVACVHQFTRIGEGSFISGGAMANTDVAPYCIAQGDRAIIRGLNIVGLRRAGLKRENIKALRDAYRVMFQSKMTVAEALASVEGSVTDPYAKKFFDFFRDPKRGYARPSGDAHAEEETAAL